MKCSNIQFLACPLCHGAIEIMTGDGDEQITEGTLQCVHCTTTFPITRRMANLIPLQSTEVHKLREMQGWVNLWEKKGMYANPTTFHSVSLPFIGGMWTEVGQMFVMALEKLRLSGRERILDIGAGQGWASRYFAAKGCHVFATDIVEDESYGLGRAWAIMEHAGVYFEPLLADGERLPFADNQFDIVFTSAALHHFVKPETLLTQAYRVLRPGGRVISINEPAIAIFAKESAAIASMEEVEEGIVERRPKVFEYMRALRTVGFRHIQVDTYATHHASQEQLRAWQIETRRHLMHVVRPSLRPLVWAVYSGLALFPGRITGQIALHIQGGNILLHARKPS